MSTPQSEWPLGLCHELATIDALAVRKHLVPTLAFSRDHDDLDSFSYALFEAEGQTFALQLYDNAPTGDFTLLGRTQDASVGESLDSFLRWSGIAKAAVKWVRPDVPKAALA